MTESRWSVIPETGELVVPVESPFDHTMVPIPHLNMVWSYYNHQSALENAGFTPQEWLRVRDAFLMDWKVNPLLIPQDDQSVYSILVYIAEREEVKSDFKDICKAILGGIEKIGGDDGYFDEFPALFDILGDLTLAFTQAFPGDDQFFTGLANWVRQTSVNFRYYEDDEALSLVGADRTYLLTRDQYLRRGWLKPVGDFFGNFRYTHGLQDVIKDLDVDSIPSLWIEEKMNDDNPK